MTLDLILPAHSPFWAMALTYSRIDWMKVGLNFNVTLLAKPKISVLIIVSMFF